MKYRDSLSRLSQLYHCSTTSMSTCLKPIDIDVEYPCMVWHVIVILIVIGETIHHYSNGTKALKLYFFVNEYLKSISQATYM